MCRRRSIRNTHASVSDFRALRCSNRQLAGDGGQARPADSQAAVGEPVLSVVSGWMTWDLDPEGAVRSGVLDGSPRAILVRLEHSLTEGHLDGQASRLRQPVASQPDSVRRQSFFLGGRAASETSLDVEFPDSGSGAWHSEAGGLSRLGRKF